MCNSSLQIDNSTTSFEESRKWFMYCVCHGHFGTVVLAIMTTIYLLMGTPISCYILWLFLHWNIKPSFVFPLNITLVDLVFCIQCCGELTATFNNTLVSYKLTLFLTTLCWTVRPLFQICMCLEHYLAVIHPVTFLRYKGMEHRIALAAAAWIIGLANSFRVIFMKHILFPDHIFFLFFWIAVIIICFCCASVLHTLKHSGPVDRGNKRIQSSKTDRGRSVENQQKRKAFKIISHILMSILVCYLPQVVTFITLIAEINREAHLCNVFPLGMSITIATLFISPLVSLYNDGHLKHIMRFSKLAGQTKDK